LTLAVFYWKILKKGDSMAEAKVENQVESTDIAIDEDDTMRDKYLTFLLGGEVYAASIEYVIEIVGVQQITDVPDMPNFVKGVINLRGQVIPVIDVRLRFGMEPKEYDDRTCIMVTRMKNLSVGLIVDMVEEVRDITKDLVAAAPKVATSSSGRFIDGIAHMPNNLVIIIIDINKLLHDNELGALAGEEEE
jgi:purine-binding chemotaxis protein CheW